jgi:hypothetical protein
MNKRIKILLVLAGLGVLCIALLYVFYYNKPHPNYEKKAPDYFLSAQELFTAYRDNQDDAQAKFNGTMVAVEGELTTVDLIGENLIAYFVLDEGFFGNEGIRITMLPGQENLLKGIELSSLVTIKGYVSGYDETDVKLLHGSLLNN